MLTDFQMVNQRDSRKGEANRRLRQKNEKNKRTSYDRFANSIPNDFPCECRLCRQICINCSFAQQQIKRQRQRELEQRRQQQQQQRQQQQQQEQEQQIDRRPQQKETEMESSEKIAKLGIPGEKGWRDMLHEDEEYRETMQGLEKMISASHKTEVEMRKMKIDKEFSKHLGLVKEYRKWSNEVYSPKVNQIYKKSDATKDKNGLSDGYEDFLKRDAVVRRHRAYPYDRIYLDRWNAQQYDPWTVAKASLKQTTTFCGSSDPLSIQERHFLEEARGLHLLKNGSKTVGTPPLRAMKAWLKMPYSYYAWQQSGKWNKHWKGVEQKLPEVPSVCRSDAEAEEKSSDDFASSSNVEGDDNENESGDVRDNDKDDANGEKKEDD